MFVYYTKSNYHLLPSSLYIDGIIIPGLTNDTDGNPICSGITSDIDPFEYTTVAGMVNTVTFIEDVEVYPNPFNSFFRLQLPMLMKKWLKYILFPGS